VAGALARRAGAQHALPEYPNGSVGAASAKTAHHRGCPRAVLAAAAITVEERE
jgi:hypothetical protein